MPGDSRRTAFERTAGPAFVVAAVIVIYWRALSAYFFEDDFQWLARMLVFHPADLLHLSLFTHFYRPVVELYFWAATRVFGGSAPLFHAFNIAVHALNGLLLMKIAARAGREVRFGFAAALLFVVLPGYVEAVAWVGALAEPVGAFFGCSSLYWFLDWRLRGARWSRGLSLATFFVALMTHESSVVFLPLIALADWLLVGPRGSGRAARSMHWAVAFGRAYLPYVALLAFYVAIDVAVNRRNYLVSDREYAVGLHIIRNILGYVSWLYVGKQKINYFVVSAAVIAALLIAGTPRVRFATLWVLLTLLPFSLFTWGNISRYLYLPAMGFALLLAEGVWWIDRRLSTRMRPRARHVVVAVVVAAVAIRFALFATRAVAGFAERTEAYREFAETYRSRYPHPASYSRLPVDPRVDAALTHRYLEALIQWEYRDPTLQLEVEPGGPHPER